MRQNHPVLPGCQPFPLFVRLSSHGVPPHAGQDQPRRQRILPKKRTAPVPAPVTDMFHLARGKVFRYRTVTGHFLMWILSVAFSSLIGSHLPFHRGRSYRRCHSRSWRYSGNGVYLGRADRISQCFQPRRARSSMRFSHAGIPSRFGEYLEIRPSILSGSP